MRLLKHEGNFKFSLTEYYGDETPPYAILSHTWGLDRDEATFRDLMDGTGVDKFGYQKICFCNKQRYNISGLKRAGCNSVQADLVTEIRRETSTSPTYHLLASDYQDTEKPAVPNLTQFMFCNANFNERRFHLYKPHCRR
jgi:hypothetical protein